MLSQIHKPPSTSRPIRKELRNTAYHTSAFPPPASASAWIAEVSDTSCAAGEGTGIGAGVGPGSRTARCGDVWIPPPVSWTANVCMIAPFTCCIGGNSTLDDEPTSEEVKHNAAVHRAAARMTCTGGLARAARVRAQASGTSASPSPLYSTAPILHKYCRCFAFGARIVRLGLRSGAHARLSARARYDVGLAPGRRTGEVNCATRCPCAESSISFVSRRSRVA